MPPKKVEEVQLQAVVLCDSYQPRFQPLTRTQPRCLLPLANTPLLEYTLEFLVSAKVSEVFLLCCAHGDQISAYIKNKKWGSQLSPFKKLSTIELPNSSSVGDALRSIDSQGVLKGDFLLVSGDVVCTVDFSKIWDAHIKRRKADRNCIMTVMLRQGAALHRTRSSHTGLYILDDSNQRVVGYRSSVLDKNVSLDAGELLSRSSVSFRNDLIDCHIDICSLDVPALFTENFDYEFLRRDFVNGILQSDLLGKTIYAEIVDQDYAARVESLRTYDSISKDIISRYTYPLVVDSNEGLVDQTYRYYKGHIYKEKDVVLSHSCHIGTGTVIGSKTRVGAGTVISGSCIGRNCVIGDNVVIKNAYIWDDVVVADNCTVEQSILASNVKVGENSKLVGGTIISFGYDVPAGSVFEGETLHISDDDSDNDSDESERAYNTESDASIDQLAGTLDRFDMSSDDSFASARELHSIRMVKKTHRSQSMNSVMSVQTEGEDEEDFFKEAVASIDRSIVDKHSQDVAVLELNTLRMTMNASHDKVQAAAIHALIKHIGHLVTASDVKTACTTVFATWSPLLKRITFDREGEVYLATCLEQECSKRPQCDKLLFYSLSTLYDQDVITEEAVFEWFKQPPAAAGQLREIVAKWVEWLMNAEEESDSEEADGDSED